MLNKLKELLPEFEVIKISSNPPLYQAIRYKGERKIIIPAIAVNKENVLRQADAIRTAYEEYE